MERQYKAFISYRHLPLDMQVARKLHRRIEHFVIPRKLRKDGQKSPGLVFRDEDELPSSSDLSMNIQEALDHSEFLIVICTPETPASDWVSQEISYFLKHHDRDHVLAVLADGTPGESFPPQLTSTRASGPARRDAVSGDDVSESSDQTSGNLNSYSPADNLSDQIEPLAANIVADSERRRNRLLQTESLRILAALIGCTYDELYQREQRYRTGRAAAAAAVVIAVAAVVIGILVNRNAVIRANYEQALRNQSVYLAKESMDLSDSGDQLGAIALAMEGLPSEERDRPLVSKAEFALGYAAHAYLAPGNALGLTGTGILHHSNGVEVFRQNRKGDSLCVLTKDNILVCWDPHTLHRKWETDLGRQFSSFDIGLAGFLNDSDPLYWTDDYVCCIDGETGGKKWTMDRNELLQESYDSIYSCGIAEEEKTVIVCSSSGVARLDPGTGKKISYFDWPEFGEEGEEASYNFLSARIDSRTSLLAVQFDSGTYPDELRGIAVIDAADGTLRGRTGGMPDTLDLYLPYKYVFPDEDHVIFVTSDLSGGSASTMLGVLHTQVYSENVLNCLDLKSGEIVWTSAHRSSFTGANDILLFDDSLTDKPLLAYAYANHLDLVDPADGTVLSSAEYKSRIISLDIVGSRLICVTEDGLQGYLDPGNTDTWQSADYFTDRIVQAESRAGSVWLVSSKAPEDLVHYSTVTPDPAWRDTPAQWTGADGGKDFFTQDCFLTDGCFALLDDYRLLISDGTAEGPLREAELPHEEEAWPKTEYYMGHLNDGIFTLLYSKNDEVGMLHVDMASLRQNKVRWTQEDLRIIWLGCAETGSEYYAVCCRNEGDEQNPAQNIILCVLDDDMHVRKQVSIGSFEDLTTVQSILQEDRYLYICLPEIARTYCIDVQKDRVTICHEDVSDAFARAVEEESSAGLDTRVCFCPDSRNFAAETAPGTVQVVHPEKGTLFTLQRSMPDILAMTFTPDGRTLLTLDTGGYMNRFSAENGAFLGRTEIWYSSALTSYQSYKWQFTDRGFLVLTAGDCANLISLADWGVYAYVQNCFGYEETADFFPCYTYETGSRTYGGFTRYTTEGLQKYASSLLNGWELSLSQREEYGLD